MTIISSLVTHRDNPQADVLVCLVLRRPSLNQGAMTFNNNIIIYLEFLKYLMHDRHFLSQTLLSPMATLYSLFPS